MLHGPLSRPGVPGPVWVGLHPQGRAGGRLEGVSSPRSSAGCTFILRPHLDSEPRRVGPSACLVGAPFLSFLCSSLTSRCFLVW